MVTEDDLELNNPESAPEGFSERKKIRVKKRIRIKKKKDPKRKLKKALKTTMWTLVIIAIIVTFIILINQLNIADKDTNAKKKRGDRLIKLHKENLMVQWDHKVSDKPFYMNIV